MRVGIDYFPATTHWPGSGRYARELVRALVAEETRPDLRLFDVGRGERTVDPRALNLPFGDPRVRRVTRGVPRRALSTLARAGYDAARMLGGIDVFHHVHANGPPIRRVPQVLAIAELPARRSLAGAALLERAQDMGALVVFCADWRLRVAEALAFPLERIHVTRVGCEHWRRALAEIPPADDPPRILVLGATRHERRPSAVLRGFERLRERGVDARLLFAGRDGDASAPLGEAVRASRYGADVERRRDVREADLPELVARSSVLVHLDPNAGTPVTPLEALATGIPAVVTRTPCFAEHLDGAVEWVDDAEIVREPDVLAAAIERAIASRADGLARVERAARAREYSWARCARETVKVWQAVV